MAYKDYVIVSLDRTQLPGRMNIATFWRPMESGYTTSLVLAGRYSKERAFQIQKQSMERDLAIPLAEARKAEVSIVDYDRISATAIRLGIEKDF